MKEVSCRQFGFWFRIMEERGKSVERGITRLPYTREYLLNPANRIDWSEYVLFSRDAVAELGGIEAMRDIHTVYGDSMEMRYVSRIASLFANPRKAYEFILFKHGASLYTHLDIQLHDLEDGRLELRIRIPDEYEDCPEWFWGSEFIFATITQIIGLPRAQITTEVQERLGIYTITLPESRTLWSQVKRLARSLLAPLGYLQIVETQLTELRTLAREVAAERDNLTHLISTLADGVVIITGEEVRFTNPAFRRMFDGPAGEESEVESHDAGFLPRFLARAQPGVRIPLPSGLLIEVLGRSAVTLHGESGEMIVVRDVTRVHQMETHVAAAASREREKLACDLHDGLGQYFAALNFKASALMNRNEPDAEEFREIAELARSAAILSKGIVYGMGPGYAEERNVIASLRMLCMRMEKLHPVAFRFNSPLAGAETTAVVAMELFLLIKEALSHVAHPVGSGSRSKTITLAVEHASEGWEFSIFSGKEALDFAGLVEPQGAGVETVGFRAARLGGEVRMTPESAVDRQITIRLPSGTLSISTQGADPAPAIAMGAPASRDQKARVFIVDDHAIVRDGVRRLLMTREDLHYCGEAGDLENLAARLREARADTLIIDWLPGVQESDEAIRSLRREMPHLRIIVLSMFEAESHEPRARAAGADVYISKSEPPERLLDALNSGGHEILQRATFPA